ncbi:ribosome biogenesis GTPase YlqF [Halanaerobacter jeridensis]|uniref:Ribosome biogenesis GTPase A n=1 Tax=Halanaerobacter jeridensis TaxID=706427 RepID=A0A939BNE1_9FIRM|nr:ribosome biogenesis GTPase YlqF [Halanaerobacter jeridensis]MBM7555322.1 ribosome biogenesis GTPase A [Halanaerobacter jeridensis]
MSIQWYPGHMDKAKKKIKKRLNLIDVVIELLDARIPLSSRNPDIDEVLKDKKRIIALNKKDLADPQVTKQWLDYFSETAPSLAINSLSGNNVKQIFSLADQLTQEEQAKALERGRKKRDVKLMIVGVPNVGKSQLINQLGNKNKTRTGNRPGVTRGEQWVKLQQGFELLDTPGVLWSKFNDEEAGVRLALCGAIKEGRFDNELLAYKLVQILQESNPERLKERYDLDHLSPDTYQLVADIGKKRGCLQSGGKVDRNRVSKIILKEFDEGKLGRITLEQPPVES